MKYNSIQFLRTVFVFSVIFFHLSPGILDFGYLGVDGFFVLSGFFVAQSFCRGEKNFPWYKRYILKRFWRLYPALLLVTSISLIVSTSLHNLNDLTVTINSYFYSILGLSNFYYATLQGYFSDLSVLDALIHTWSLSIEIQFFVIIPFILMYVKNVKVEFVLALTLLSLASYIYFLRTFPDQIFYFSPSRFWQISLGMLAYFAYRRTFSGTLLITLSIIFPAAFFLNLNHFFLVEGYLSIIASTVVFLLLINLDKIEHFFNKLPFTKIFNFTGGYSYSLYLVHQPIIAFWFYYIHPSSITGIELLFLLGVILISALITGEIEKFFIITQSGLKIFSFTLCLVFLVLTAVSMRYFVYSEAFKFEKMFLNSQSLPLENKFCNNVDVTKLKSLNFLDCVIGDTEVVPDALVIGDSHGFSIAEGLHNHLTNLKKSAIFISNSACIPLPDLKLVNHPRQEICGIANSILFGDLIKNQDWQKVMLVGRWNYYFNNSINENEFAELEIISESNKDPSFEHGLKKLQTMIDGKIVILEQVPELNFQPDKFWFLNQKNERDLKSSMTRDYFNYHNRKVVNPDLFPLVEFINPVEYFCNAVCKYGDNKGLYYHDNDHLSSYGARKFLNSLAKSL